MLEHIKAYLACKGEKYVKPEKAGNLAEYMIDLRVLAQSARKEFQTINQLLEQQVTPFVSERVSQWMNQAQICRPHFWCYYRLPSDSVEDVALATRLYGKEDDFGISVEVSFVERKKSDATLFKQHKVLELPITEPLYYLVQENGESRCMAGTEENRQLLKEQVASGTVRKVLIKYDVQVTEEMTSEAAVHQLMKGFELLIPYYEQTKKEVGT
ncbi:HI_0552 family protein [Streptococcus hillyeri]|uniref:Ribonuclease P n=1 Tax=Streptococcus hillyeri TaxID=2282420 RepID=A0A3L9DL44_9STRE|nr:ribonuclease P [Streptococcus hillyeri]RLY01484.1 ribonuclease P [Streptococcus hillyeri]